jgi:hypothetical protein
MSLWAIIKLLIIFGFCICATYGYFKKPPSFPRIPGWSVLFLWGISIYAVYIEPPETTPESEPKNLLEFFVHAEKAGLITNVYSAYAIDKTFLTNEPGPQSVVIRTVEKGEKAVLLADLRQSEF